jgi:hypothetical protein
MSRKSTSFPLRLPVSLRQQADDLADGEGISLNQFISIAVAEKVGHMEEQARVEMRVLPNERQSFRSIERKMGQNDGGKAS